MNAESRTEPATPMTFIVRALLDDAGQLSGVVERARTGEKQRFYGVTAISPLIAQMVASEGQEIAECASEDGRPLK